MSTLKLFEAQLKRKQFVIHQYGKQLLAVFTDTQKFDQSFETLVQADPTERLVYLDWITRQLIQNLFLLEDVERVRYDLENFETKKSKLENADINQFNYNTLVELLDRLDCVDLTVPVPSDDPEVEVLYSGVHGKLLVPTTRSAAIKVGKGTRWCTSSDQTDHFTGYNNKGPLFVWVDRQSSKFQFHFQTLLFMNAQDVAIKKNVLKEWNTKHPVLSKLFRQQEENLYKLGDVDQIVKYHKMMYDEVKIDPYFVDTYSDTANKVSLELTTKYTISRRKHRDRNDRNWVDLRVPEIDLGWGQGYFRQMFDGARDFNQSLSGWPALSDVTLEQSDTNEMINLMFRYIGDD